VSARPLFRLMFVALCATAAAAHQTTTVRGRIDRVGADGHPHPAPYLTVTLRTPDTGHRTDPSYTGRDGMYYIYGVAPGTYYLEVRVLPLGALYTYRIEARSQPYTDVAPLVVP